MNVIKVYEKINKRYTLINGKAVMPFNFGMLLDERLDEAHLNIVGSNKSEYRPYTPIKIEVFQNSTLKKAYYYIVASDNSVEDPRGSGKYSHELYLIERTKWLETFYCQSLTFTNSLGKTYTSNKYSALINADYGGMVIPTAVAGYVDNLYMTPQLLSDTISVKSAGEVAQTITDFLNQASIINGPSYSWSTNLSNLFIISEGEENGYAWYESPEYQLTNTNTNIIYLISISSTTEPEDDSSNPITTTHLISFEYLITAVENKLPLAPWTIADVVDRVLSLAEVLYKGQTPRFKLNDIQKAEFKKIISPQFTMTGATLREQLKVVGGYIHAEPRLGWFNPNLIEYEENTIYFEPLGETEEATSVVNLQNFYRGKKWDGNDYCTAVETSAANIVNSLNYAEGVISDPSNNTYKTVRTESINVLLTDVNSFVQTAFPIYDIISLKCGLYNPNGVWDIPPIDITGYVFERHEYESSLSSYGGGYPYSKSYAIYYTQGEKNIRGLFFKPDESNLSIIHPYLENFSIVNILEAVTGRTDIKDLITTNFEYLAFRVDYIPIYSAKYSHGKATYEPTIPVVKVYNQSENQIESSYYGAHIKGVAQRLGQVEESRTYILGDIDNIPKVGQQIDGYSISAINTTILPNYIKCTIGLAKDFNRINEYISVDSHKRISEVSERQAQERDIILKNYIVIGYDRTPSTDEPLISTFGITEMFEGTRGNPINAIFCESYSGRDTNLANPFGEALLPAIASAFGNVMTVSWTFKDNYSAGEIIEEKDANGFWQTDASYGDFYGRAYYHNIKLLRDVYDYGLDQALTVRPISDIGSPSTREPIILRKDSREILSFNYEVEFKGKDNIIIGSSFAECCPLVTVKAYPKAKLYLLSKKLNKLEPKIAVEDILREISYEVSYFNNDISLRLPIVDPNVFECEAWAFAITDTEGEAKTYEDELGNIITVEPSVKYRVIFGANSNEFNPIIISVCGDLYKYL